MVMEIGEKGKRGTWSWVLNLRGETEKMYIAMSYGIYIFMQIVMPTPKSFAL